MQATTRLSAETYSATLPVRERGTFTFASTTGGAPGSGMITSNEVVITVEDSKITLDQPVAKIDSLKNPKISGMIVPARVASSAYRRQAIRHIPDGDDHNDRFVGPILNLAELRQGARSRRTGSVAPIRLRTATAGR